MQFVDPTIVCSQFHLRVGDTVADFGAGGGYFLQPLSQAVGSDGTVYALDIQKELVAAMGEFVRRENLNNVRVLWVDLEEPEGTTLSAGQLDAVTIINTLFQFEAAPAVFAEAYRTLRSGGKLIVIEWSESFQNLGPEPSAVVSSAAARALAEGAGFVHERDFPAGDHHYGMTFRKP
ncbi:MAG TPA: class I SAM-dependent methyltransferase [Candidatus Paceibacterota bacterium]|nr:class I SAM-dependent methyltransferase [Candidatus Paceibacterota bacterium]